MDDARFDALTQRLGSATTRRATVWGALAGAAGLLGLLDPPGSLAGKRKRKEEEVQGRIQAEMRQEVRRSGHERGELRGVRHDVRERWLHQRGLHVRDGGLCV